MTVLTQHIIKLTRYTAKQRHQWQKSRFFIDKLEASAWRTWDELAWTWWPPTGIPSPCFSSRSATKCTS